MKVNCPVLIWFLVQMRTSQLAFKNLLHPFQPFIIGQKIIGPLMALKFNIPLIIYGENQAEYGNAVEENSNPKTCLLIYHNISYSENDFFSLALRFCVKILN